MSNHIPFKPGDQVAGYFRDSGGDKQELSVARQEAEYIRWCADNGLIPGRVFKDLARPGSTVAGREQLDAMMHHFRSGQAAERGVAIWNFQRFARDFDDSQFFRADLRRRGYIFTSITDNIPDGPMGRVYEALLDWKNEQFLVDLSLDVKSGLRRLLLDYGAVPGTPPRGFRREPVTISIHRDGRPRIAHRWTPDPDQAPAVQQAFAMLLAGASQIEILQATGLYKSKNCLRTFFSNPLYKGVLEYADLVINDYCEPIIDPETWQQAQQHLVKRSNRQHLSGDNPDHPRRRNSHYLLSGLVYCARCQSPLSGLTSKKNNGYYDRYACTRAARRRDCDAKPIPRIFLEELVLTSIDDELLSPAALAGQQAIVMDGEQERQAELAVRTNDLRRRLGVVRRQIGNITETLADAGRSRALLTKLAELESDEAGLLSELAALDEQASQRPEPFSAASLELMAERIRAELRSGDVQRIRSILRGLVNRIAVERDGQAVRVQIDYYHPPEEHPPPNTAPINRGSVGAPVDPKYHLRRLKLPGAKRHRQLQSFKG